MLEVIAGIIIGMVVGWFGNKVAKRLFPHDRRIKNKSRQDVTNDRWGPVVLGSVACLPECSALIMPPSLRSMDTDFGKDINDSHTGNDKSNTHDTGSIKFLAKEHPASQRN